MYGAPVDLSHRSINSMKEAQSEKPRDGLRPVKRNCEQKYLSHCLRLSNNNISDLSDLHNTIAHFLAVPSQLAWLDLSFNHISHIHPVLCELRELRVLYLHGNGICNLPEVDRLGVLPHLHTITLHGNRIETEKGYRSHVIFALPQLKTVDFSAVTCQERVMANIWHRRNNRSRDTRKSLQ
ncbi:leucine-rich repeat-containing protein 51 [Centroberyx gerrardi]